MLRVHFKDEGQDCLRWDIGDDGTVIDCDLQKWMWVGCKARGIAKQLGGVKG